MKICNKRDFAIKISGNHYFACDYVFSNIYGESVFFDDGEPRADDSVFVGSAADSSGFSAMFPSAELSEEVLRETLPETPFDDLPPFPTAPKKSNI